MSIRSPADGTQPWKAVPKSYVNSWGLSGNIDYQITDDIKFVSVSAYRRFTAYWAQDYDASNIGSAQLTYDTWHHQFSQEVRLQGQLFELVGQLGSRWLLLRPDEPLRRP